MDSPTGPGRPSRSYVVSLDNRKARGSGHERPAEILAAARQLFLEHGVEAVTTRQIAGRVGMSQTALYVYFKSREEMLDALVEAAFVKLGDAFGRMRATDQPLDTLRLAIGCYVRFGLDSPDEYRIAFLLRDGRRMAARPTAEPHGTTTGLRVFGMLRSFVADCIAGGAINDDGDDGLATAQVLWAAVHGLVALLLAYPDFGWEPTDRLIDRQIEMLIHGLASRPAGTPATGGRRRIPATR